MLMGSPDQTPLHALGYLNISSSVSLSLSVMLKKRELESHYRKKEKKNKKKKKKKKVTVRCLLKGSWGDLNFTTHPLQLYTSIVLCVYIYIISPYILIYFLLFYFILFLAVGNVLSLIGKENWWAWGRWRPHEMKSAWVVVELSQNDWLLTRSLDLFNSFYIF